MILGWRFRYSMPTKPVRSLEPFWEKGKCTSARPLPPMHRLASRKYNLRKSIIHCITGKLGSKRGLEKGMSSLQSPTVIWLCGQCLPCEPQQFCFRSVVSAVHCIVFLCPTDLAHVSHQIGLNSLCGLWF